MSNNVYKCTSCNKELLEGLPFCPHCGQKQHSQFSKEDLKKDPYKILQIDPNADPEVIEAAYKSLAKKYHPDNNTEPLSEEKMKDINWAKGILTDPTIRHEWDRKKAQGKPIPKPEHNLNSDGEKDLASQKNNFKNNATEKGSGQHTAYIIAGGTLVMCLILFFVAYLFDEGRTNSSNAILTNTHIPKPTNTAKPSITPSATEPLRFPKIVKEEDKSWEILNTQNWHYLREFSENVRSTGEFNEPNTEYYSAVLPKEGYVLVDLSWCAIDENTLNQNLKHLESSIHINGIEVDYEERIDYSMEYEKGEFPGYDGKMVCSGYGLLTYDWPEGNHNVKKTIVFVEGINDGYDDYLPGEYVLQYTIEVINNE